MVGVGVSVVVNEVVGVVANEEGKKVVKVVENEVANEEGKMVVKVTENEVAKQLELLIQPALLQLLVRAASQV